MKRFLILLLLLVMATMARAGNLYLNIIWHQHQPLYVNPVTDVLSGPWVRTHATKDYYDMAALHEKYPNVHATVNLTSSLLVQLQNYYVDRLAPHMQTALDGKREIVAGAYFAAGISTDPWVDIALKPTESLTADDRAKLLTDPWNAFGISDVQIERFPQYSALRAKPRDQFTLEDLRDLKTWFFVAHFDPDFLRGTSALDVDLSDLIEERDGAFFLRGKEHFSERDANRAVADAVRVMQEIIPVHERLLAGGNLEIITTPFYHPILPLLIDSDIAKTCQPKSELPPRYAYPQDAHAQVIKGVGFYERLFRRAPVGMWPAEGSISQAAAEVFHAHGVRWICGDMHVLRRSLPEGLDVAKPYRVSTETGDIAVVFRETVLSDHIGFTYQNMDPDSAVEHFTQEILKYQPGDNEADRLLTVILDGENAWEWYRQDHDAKRFLHGLYARLTALGASGAVTCVHPTEYFRGNPERDVPAHPIAQLTEITQLWPGSWINANYDTWIGEPEENKAWEYLRRTREALAHSRLPQPDPHAPMEKSIRGAAIYRAYESMYAAEGSDWFWWFGADQSAPAGDRPFEESFFSHLRAVYQHMRDAGVEIETPTFEPILSADKIAVQETGGVMQRGGEKRTVRFECDARAQLVQTAIFIVGNQPELGEWVPNVKRLRDDGAAGDAAIGDGVWSLEVELPLGAEVQYKFSNSGEVGVWTPSEEFPHANRSFTVTGDPGVTIVRHDIFGARD
ncbi:MAG: hypothetical protein IPK53_02850 [bacterium]|nr:hypothetical protein [bacterium]